MKNAVFLVALGLSACAVTSPVQEPVEATDTTNKLVSGAYASPAWINETFTGTHTRRLTKNRLSFEIEQTVHGGGWDTAVGIVEKPDYPVAELDPQMAICFDYSLDLDATGTGKWWVGPKISVNWAAMTDAPSIGDWYENYVVEWANQSPAELEADLFDLFEAESLGETIIAGSTYRHVKLRFHDWWQYWSIRQDYRSSGQMTIGPIIEAWAGMPSDLPFDGIKANIETHGPISGSGVIHADIATEAARLNCK